MQIELDIDNPCHREAARAMLDVLDGRTPDHVTHSGLRPEHINVVTDRDVSLGDPVYAEGGQQTPPPPPPPAHVPTGDPAEDSQHAGEEPHQGQYAEGRVSEFPEGCDPNDLDDAGTPYYIEIHTGTRSKKKDGTWKYMRGLKDRAEAERIEAELRELVRATRGGEPAKEPEPEAGADEPLFGRTSYPGSVFGDGSESPTPPPPPPPAASKNNAPETVVPNAVAPSNDTPPPPPPPPGQISFATIMRQISKERPGDQVVNEALAAEGVTSLPGLATEPNKIPAVYARIFPNG